MALFGCLSPVAIEDEKHGCKMVVPCRKCAYCLDVRKNELCAMIEREMNNPRNQSVYFMDLDYNNHSLPVYHLDKFTNKWVSNRSYYTRKLKDGTECSFYPPLEVDEVDRFYLPQNYKKYPYAFGHLCYSDITKLFRNVKARFVVDTQRGTVKHLFESYEELQFRYFVCGEYGPVTFRPHYHVLLWFPKKYTPDQFNYIRKVFSSCWSFGRFDINTLKTEGVGHYVASYITSFANCPKVLQTKSLRPLSRFSTSPIVGAYKCDTEEIREFIRTGVVKRVKFDAKTSSFIDDVVPSSFFRRHFPKIRGFSRKDFNDQLQLYSYVYNQYKNGSLKVDVTTLSSLDDLKLKHVYFAPYYDKYYNEMVTDWTYSDKYASLVFFKYCVNFNIEPVVLLRSFIKIYSNLQLKSLNGHYEDVVNQAVTGHNSSSSYINHDCTLLDSLPLYAKDLSTSILGWLVFYGLNIDVLYPNGFLDFRVLRSYFLYSDPLYQSHEETYKEKYFKSIKQKKFNDYKKNLISKNLLHVYSFDSLHYCYIKQLNIL